MNELVMLCGIPGSGKSTYAEQLKKEGYIIHSSDDTREQLGDINDQSKNEEVFRLLHKRIKDDLRGGKNVVYDATNISRKRRMAFLRELQNIPCKKVCVLIATPYEICVAQNFKRERRVPVEVIWKMYKNFNLPCKEEGFDEVVIHYPKEEWKEYYGEIEEYVRGLRNFDQHNHHHTLTLGDHMLTAMDYILHSNGRVYNDVVIATLAHDIGKAEVKEFKNRKGEDTTEAHYYQHHFAGCYKSLFFKYPSYANKEYIALLIELHMKPHKEWEQDSKVYQKDLSIFGQDILNDVWVLHEADVYAH